MTPKAPRPLRALAALAAVAMLAAGCAKGTSSPGASLPRSGASLSTPAVKLAVLHAVGGHLDYCDPDEFPVARGTPLQNAERRLPQIRENRTVFDAILSSLHIGDASHLTDQQIVAISQAYKQMLVIQLHPSGDLYSFAVSVPAAAAGATGMLSTPTETVTGTVSRTGQVHIGSRKPGAPRACPICLARGDLIATPSGPVAVQDVRVAMKVWSVNAHGRRIRAVVVRTGRALVPLGHEVVRLVLADGRTIEASAGHPTIDGRTVGSLHRGARFDGSTVVAVELVPYGAAFTYDLLASGPTGAYFVNGVLLASTLAPARVSNIEAPRAR